VTGRALKVVVPVAVLAVAAAVVAMGASASGKAKNVLVFGTSSDPVALDGALISDGESGRVVSQIYEGLVALKAGTTTPIPGLALSWSASKNGLIWTFKLRQGVTFTDGTPFNAAAVCSNFSRWYDFTGSFQNPDATYYWQTVFGGFRHPEPGSPTSSIYRGCKAIGKYTVHLFLTQRSASFISALSAPSFSMESPTAMAKYGANQGSVDSNGVFHPTGTYATQHPTGTGPFMLKSWKVGDKLELVPNPHYWGKKPSIQRLIFKPISDNAARLQALQSGEIDGYDLVAPQDIPTLKSSGFQILSRPAFNVAYVGFNSSKPPLDNQLVRQAVAYGLDRQSVVNSFYAGRAQVAQEFMPPQLFGYSKKVQKYTYDPNKSKALLRQAGLTLPVKLDFWYPTNVTRPYMPDPKANFEAFSAGLEKAGFQIVAHSAPWRPDYLSAINKGEAQMYLVGWTGDWGDPDNFIGTFFRTPQDAWGNFKDPALYALLNKALGETDPDKRVGEYQLANEMIMKFLPGVPYAHTSPALAFRKGISGYVPSPVDLQQFNLVTVK
jgi:peptide/nickel transport system substrate-binding protein